MESGRILGPSRSSRTYYGYALLFSTRVSFDYQFTANPTYNPNGGPANVFSGSFRRQFQAL